MTRTATKENIDEVVARGQALWDTIYTPQAEKLYNKLGAYHPDFIGESPSSRSPPSIPHPLPKPAEYARGRMRQAGA